jgi:hypothetical protein
LQIHVSVAYEQPASRSASVARIHGGWEPETGRKREKKSKKNSRPRHRVSTEGKSAVAVLGRGEAHGELLVAARGRLDVGVQQRAAADELDELAVYDLELAGGPGDVSVEWPCKVRSEKVDRMTEGERSRGQGREKVEWRWVDKKPREDSRSSPAVALDLALSVRFRACPLFASFVLPMQ